MDILLSMTTPWPDMIFAKKKPFEFRNFSAKNFSEDDKVYIYESKSHGGQGKVVGYFSVKRIFQINLEGFVERNFLPYYCEHILKDTKMAIQFQKAIDTRLSEYKPGTAIMFALDENAIDYIQTFDKWPEFTIDGSKLWGKTKNVVISCDKWLYSIGFFNNYMETNYEKAIEIDEPIQFNEAIELNNFFDTKCVPLSRAPQSWQYVSGRKEF